MLRTSLVLGLSLAMLAGSDASAQSLDAPDYWSVDDKKDEKSEPPVEQEFEKTVTIERKKSNLVICSEGAASGEELESALAACNAAIEEQPQNGDAYYYRGFTFFHMGRYADAERDFTSAIDLGARWLAESYYQRGACKERQHRLREASVDFKAAHDLKPQWSAARRKVEEYHWAFE